MTRARVAKGMSAEVCVSDMGLVQLSGNPRSDKTAPGITSPVRNRSGRKSVRQETGVRMKESIYTYVIDIYVTLYNIRCPLKKGHNTTRQSEMANTSPRHMSVLGNVHPIKIENFDIFA